MSEGTPARYGVVERGRLVCTVCPRRCTLGEGQTGFCGVRRNEGGQLTSLVYGRPSAVAVDPIEKKPLFHFLPGSSVLSIGTRGCNLGCRFCQNSDLSRARGTREDRPLAPRDVPGLAASHDCASVAFTYNDPTVFVEYAADAARACREVGIATVGVTAGYIGPEARAELYPLLDAANIDLKGFREDFYWRLTGGHLAPVLETIEFAVRAGVWVELTTLLIPGHNDSAAELRAQARWMVEHLGPDVPLHLSAFRPAYRLLEPPATPPETLRRARETALEAGVRFVYTGNVRDPAGAATTCARCGTSLITRRWHSVEQNALVGSAACPACGTVLPGVFAPRPASSP